MIRLTRLNGTELAVNADLVQRAEATPDTVVTLVDGSRYIVAEGLDEVVRRVAAFRARVLRLARDGLSGAATGAATGPVPDPATGTATGADTATATGTDTATATDSATSTGTEPGAGADIADIVEMRHRRP